MQTRKPITLRDVVHLFYLKVRRCLIVLARKGPETHFSVKNQFSPTDASCIQVITSSFWNLFLENSVCLSLQLWLTPLSIETHFYMNVRAKAHTFKYLECSLFANRNEISLFDLWKMYFSKITSRGPVLNSVIDFHN